VKDALLRAAASVPSLRRNPEPLVIMTEAAESWVSYKLVYFLDDYGSQWVIADQVISQALDSLQRAGIATAPPRLELVGTARA
jgi:small-conductance mechanosensitive channel